MQGMNGPPGQHTYYVAYQWYKSLELATPIVEFTLALLTVGYLSLYQRP